MYSGPQKLKSVNNNNNNNHHHNNCVNNKMHEYDWLLTALIYGSIGFFRSKLSDMYCLIPLANELSLLTSIDKSVETIHQN